MVESILAGKKILAIDDEPDVLAVLEEEILSNCPNCKFDKATSYHTGLEKLQSERYDLVILDIMGVRGFDLLNLAVTRKISVSMLTAHAFHPKALKQSIEMGARAYLPKEKMGEIVPFLEDLLKYPYGSGWRRLFKNLEPFFNTHWGESWQQAEEIFWNEFKEKTSSEK